MLVIEQLLGRAGDLSRRSTGSRCGRAWTSTACGATAPSNRARPCCATPPAAACPCTSTGATSRSWCCPAGRVDDRRRYDAGTLFVSAPGTRHAVISPEGCVVLAVWAGGVESSRRR